MNIFPENQQPPPDKQEALWSAWYTPAALAAAWVLSSLPVFALDSTTSIIGANLVGYLLQAGCFILIPLIIASHSGGTISALGFVRTNPARGLAVGISAGIALYLINVALSNLTVLLFPEGLEHQQAIIQLFAQANNQLETILLVLVMVTLAPVSEEILFRAFFLPPLTRRFGRWPAIFISAAVFAATHFDLWVFVPLFAGGIGFAWLYDKYGNIWYNIIAHAVWNIVALSLFFILGF